MKLVVAVALSLVASTAHADRFYVRGGLMYLEPNISMRDLQVDSALVGMMAAVQGSVEASTALTPAAVIGWNVWQRLAIEAVVAWPTTVTLRANGPLADQSLAPTL